MKPVRTWILLADGARARVVCNLGPGKGVSEVADMTYEGDNRRTGEVMADRPGRSFDSTGQHRHAMEPPTDAQRELKRGFADKIIQALQDKHDNDAFDRLIIVAAPATLGDLRKAMPKSLQQIVHAQVPKDLVNLPDTELNQHLSDVLPV